MKEGLVLEKKKVLIIGAGIGGLSTGHWLQEKGYDVELLEALDRPGGRIASIEFEGDKVDVGAEFFHSNYKYVFEMIEKFGLSKDLRKTQGGSLFMFEDGTAAEVSDTSWDVSNIGWRNRFQLLWFMAKYIFFRRRSRLFMIDDDRPELDSISLHNLFTKPSEKKVRELLVAVAKTGSNCGPEWISLYHLVQLIRIVMFTEFSVLKGGTATLSHAIAKTLNVQLNSPVEQVVYEDGRIIGVRMQGTGKVKLADHVVVATTPLAAKRILPEELSAQRAFFESVPQAPLPKPIFFLDGPIRKDIWSYFNEPDKDRLFGFAVDESIKTPSMVPSGRAVLRAYACYPRSLELTHKSDEEILELALADLDEMIPGLKDRVVHSQVFWHKNGGLAHYPAGAYGRIINFQKKADQLKGVSFVSDYFGGSYIEGAMNSAARAVNRICQTTPNNI